MLPPPPASLKPIAPWIRRGSQMLKPDPVIAYQCYFWATNVAISKSLHTTGPPECAAYLASLMGELEKMRAELAGNELLEDDMAAQAYVENFALKVFENGRKAIDGRRVNEKTPDTLQAAITFLELLAIWDAIDEETAKKIKFSKYHAARILKALKAGEDPNIPEPEAAISPPGPSVEEIPDEGDTFAAPAEPRFDPTPQQQQTPPAEYFPPQPPPQAPSFGTVPPTFNSPPAPAMVGPTDAPSSMDLDLTFSPGKPPPQVPSFPPSMPQESLTFAPPSAPAPVATPPWQNAPPPPQAFPPTTAPGVPSQQFSGGMGMGAAGGAQTQRKAVSPEDMAKAQKFAKWAISALEFEDVENAIEQFQLGLKQLGAS